ncbi:hypothetical protein BHE74_00002306 [Ensete ventricosum]|nr:hypothetical protein GW17_00004198 [Ensete ventricosum]RWW88798.1 hypothetical protein BHE74_00002306 [Ensete ventricosum]
MPAVVVCGKRSSSIFEDLHLHAPPPASKRARCASDAFLSTPALQRSPLADRGNGENSGEGTNLFAANLAHLRSLFPEMDQQLINGYNFLQLLERALEESGNDLDSTLQSLNDLHLETTKFNLDSSVSKSEIGVETNVQPLTEGVHASQYQCF